jgi:hypothetical protein
VSRTLVAALLCMLFVALPVQAAPNAGTRTISIRLISTTYSAKTIEDRAPKNVVSKGDVIVITSFLRNAIAQLGSPKGAVVGGDSATFTVLTSTQADLRLETSPEARFGVAAGSISGWGPDPFRTRADLPHDGRDREVRSRSRHRRVACSRTEPRPENEGVSPPPPVARGRDPQPDHRRTLRVAGW